MFEKYRLIQKNLQKYTKLENVILKNNMKAGFIYLTPFVS